MPLLANLTLNPDTTITTLTTTPGMSLSLVDTKASASSSETSPPKTIQPKQGVKVEVAGHGANIVHSRPQDVLKASRPKQLFKAGIKNRSLLTSYEDKDEQSLGFLQSSFEDDDEQSLILKATNGFVDTVIRAYNDHHHLIIRLEDVWLSIIVRKLSRNSKSSPSSCLRKKTSPRD
jgi:hypothetical protein